MTETTYPDGVPAARIEITNGTQTGPSKISGQFGTRFDYTNAGRMIFIVELVDFESNRLTLCTDASYEAAIIEAENAAKEWEVPVDDLVGPGEPPLDPVDGVPS